MAWTWLGPRSKVVPLVPPSCLPACLPAVLPACLPACPPAARLPELLDVRRLRWDVVARIRSAGGSSSSSIRACRGEGGEEEGGGSEEDSGGLLHVECVLVELQSCCHLQVCVCV